MERVIRLVVGAQQQPLWRECSVCGREIVKGKPVVVRVDATGRWLYHAGQCWSRVKPVWS